MKLYKLAIIFLIYLFSNQIISAQKTDDKKLAIKSTPAYAELLLRKVEMESEVESLLITYKDDFSKVKDARYELALIEKDLEKILNQSDPNKMTLALGKLLVRKNQLEADYWSLQNRYGEDHPEAKRTKKKVLIFQNAVKEIFP